MKILKRIGWFLLAILVILLIASFLLPKDISFEKSIEIDAPKNMVYNVVSDLNSHESWNPWKLNDKTMEYTYPGNRKGENATYSWTSENSGNGTYLLTKAEEGQLLESKITFEGQGEGTGRFRFEENEGKTKVSWGFESTMPWPMNLMAPFMKGQMNKSLVDGLQGISDFVKNRKENKEYSGFKINVVDVPAKHYIMNRQEVPMDNIQQFYASNLGALFGKALKAGVEMDGMPSGLFFKWLKAEGKTDMAAGIPVKEAVNVSGAASFSLAARKGLQIDYYGDYTGTQSAHNAISEYMDDYGLLQDYPVIEEYVTDPSTETDPKKWLTKITYYYSE